MLILILKHKNKKGLQIQMLTDKQTDRQTDWQTDRQTADYCNTSLMGAEH